MNTYIKCPESKEAEFRKEAQSTVESLYNMFKRFHPENQVKYLKQQMEQQITIQMVKSWHAQNNLNLKLRDCATEGKKIEEDLRAKELFYSDLINDYENRLKDKDQDIENLKRQIR